MLTAPVALSALLDELKQDLGATARTAELLFDLRGKRTVSDAELGGRYSSSASPIALHYSSTVAVNSVL